MRRFLILFLALGACVGAGDSTTTTTAPATTTSQATTTTEPPPDCPKAPYDLGFLPTGVGSGDLDPEALEPDEWTSVPGSHTTFIPRNDDTLAIALIRGTLPVLDWPGDKGEVSIDGTRAAVGPHPDGTCVVGWYEEPGERCDLYTMVFYPPWNPSEVEEVLLGMNRVGG